MRTNRLQFRCFAWFLMFVFDDFDSQACGHAQTAIIVIDKLQLVPKA